MRVFPSLAKTEEDDISYSATQQQSTNNSNHNSSNNNNNRKRPARPSSSSLQNRPIVSDNNKKQASKRIRSSDRIMTAPTQLDDSRHGDCPSESVASSAWEENEPVPLRNHNYYKTQHKGSPQLANATSNPYHDAASADPSMEEEEEHFRIALKGVGLEIVEQEGDGNCLFRAVSLQIYGDASMHSEIRDKCCNFMAVNEEHFGQFVTGEPFQSYIARKRKNGVHGNNPEIQAVSELFNRPIQVYSPLTGAKPLNIFHSDYATSDAPIRLSYHDGNHYNAVIDPSTPTAGLGLGLPGLKPGLADKLQVATATAESDVQHDLEQAIKESQKDSEKYHDDQLQRVLKESTVSMDSVYQNKALQLSDADATEFELEQSILEASLQSYQMQEGSKRPAVARSPSHKAGAKSNNEQSPSVAAAAVASSTARQSSSPTQQQVAADEYPAVVQELVMNGFDLYKVVRAYELIGNNFDDLLTFLVSNS